MGLIEKFKAEQVKAHERAANRPPSGMAFGISYMNGTIKYKRTKGPVFGVVARVEGSGDVEHRLIRHDIDRRKLYLAVEGDGFGFIVEVDPDERTKAERFAMALNAAGRWTPPAGKADENVN